MNIMQKIEGYLNPGDYEMLTLVASEIPENGYVIEVGSFKGLSTSIIACNARTAQLHCVDTWEGPLCYEGNEDLYKIFQDNCKYLKIDDRVTTYKMTSHDAAHLFDDSCADVVFIDGDHTEKGCYSDLMDYWPKMKEDGLFLVHDCDWSQKGHVYSAVKRFLGEHRNLGVEIFAPPRSNYIANINRLIDGELKK